MTSKRKIVNLKFSEKKYLFPMQSFAIFWNIYIDNKLKDLFMKRFLTLMACLVAIATAYGQDNYYWNEGNQVTTEKDYSKYYIFHYSKDLYDLLQTEAYSRNVLNNDEVGTVGCVYREGMEQKLQGSYFATINSVILDEILQKYDVPYYSPYYKIERHTNPVSNFFYVKLKSEDDVALLEQQAEQSHVEIVGNNELMPLWYTLICFDNKSGTSIECGNKIYESGDFQAVSYDIMNSIIPLSVLPIVNQSLIIKKKSSNVIEVNLNNSSTYKNIQLCIYSPSGLLVKQFNYENESSFSKEINLSDLKPNVYICVINADGQKTTKTFVK